MVSTIPPDDRGPLERWFRLTHPLSYTKSGKLFPLHFCTNVLVTKMANVDVRLLCKLPGNSCLRNR